MHTSFKRMAGSLRPQLPRDLRLKPPYPTLLCGSSPPALKLKLCNNLEDGYSQVVLSQDS